MELKSQRASTRASSSRRAWVNLLLLLPTLSSKPLTRKTMISSQLTSAILMHLWCHSERALSRSCRTSKKLKISELHALRCKRMRPMQVSRMLGLIPLIHKPRFPRKKFVTCISNFSSHSVKSSALLYQSSSRFRTWPVSICSSMQRCRKTMKTASIWMRQPSQTNGSLTSSQAIQFSSCGTWTQSWKLQALPRKQSRTNAQTRKHVPPLEHAKPAMLAQSASPKSIALSKHI